MHSPQIQRIPVGLFLSNLIILILCSGMVMAQNTAEGEKTFKKSCSACHSIGKGKIVGPDLAGVTKRRNTKWLNSFIKSSQTMVKSNDPIAVKLFNEHNKIPMPDQNLSDAQIKDVLAYITSKSPGTVSTTPAKANTQTTGKPVVSAVKPTATKTPEKKPEPEWIAEEYQLKAYPVAADINPKDLSADVWKNIKPLRVPVAVQNMAYPNLTKASLDSLSVKCMYREKQLAFLVEWKDESKNLEVDVDKFCDQFAVELPLKTDEIPSYMMGNSGNMVHIVHWKAIWQQDCEEGFQDVQMKYPNMWVDVYPGLESYLDRSKKIYAQDITSVQIVETHSYTNMPGTYSHNPMSQIKRKEPVEEANAEGFGTLATQETQQAKGWAEWKDGKWKLCVVVPVNTGNIYKAAYKDKTKVAFALWDGGMNNIGGRKHFIPWVDIFLQKP